MTRISGILLIIVGWLMMGGSISTPSDTPALMGLGLILFIVGIVILVLPKILGNRKKKASCNCCKCSNCDLEHDHWSHS